MKNLLHWTLFLIVLPLAFACSDHDAPTPPAPEPPPPFSPLPSYTVAGNQLNMGQAASDAENFYYWIADTPTSITLCAKNKTTGKVTNLDRNEQEKANSDFMFQNLYAHEGYLYYYTFDPKNNRRAFFRTKTDGSTTPEKFSDNGYYTIIYTDSKIFLHNTTTGEFKETNYDGSNTRTLFTKERFAYPAYYNGRFYYQDYEGSYEEGNFHSVIRTCDITGNDDRKIHDFRDSGKFIIGKNCIYLYDTTPNASEAEIQADFNHTVAYIPFEGGEETVLLKDLPASININTYNDHLFISVFDSETPQKNGLYVYKTGEANPTLIIKERPIIHASIIGDNQLIFSDLSTTVSRMGKLYLTDFAGTNTSEMK